MKISDLFLLHPGNNLELYHMEAGDDTGIHFISRTAQNNGIAAQVFPHQSIPPFPAGYLTVALGGSVLSAFVQEKPFYTAFHIMVLEPKKEMSLKEKLFYCMCIKKNNYRYSYGRQANKTLKDIDVPEVLPEWAQETNIFPVATSIKPSVLKTDTTDWKEFTLGELFTVKYGINMELIHCQETTADDPDAVAFVARTSVNNGIAAYVKRDPLFPPQPAGLITCAGGGSVLSTFVQNRDFYSGRDLYLLIPKTNMNIYSKLFCCTVIRSNKYRYSYGRQANKTLSELILKLPANTDYTPDFKAMERYMKALPFSDRIKP